MSRPWRPARARHPEDATPPQLRSRLAAVLVLLALIGLLFVPAPGRFAAPWIGCLEDLAHVPLLAGVTWALELALGGRTAVAAATALIIAVVAEPLQTLAGRSSSLADLARGVCGIAMFVGWRRAGQIANAPRRRAARLAALAIGAAWPLTHAWPTIADSLRAWREFPVLADFTSAWEDRRWYVEGCRLTCEPGPRAEGDGVLSRQSVGESPSSIILFPIRRDWSAWDALHVEFTVEGGPTAVTLSVRDGRRVAPPRRRFDRREECPGGRHRFAVDLVELARGSPEVAPVDISAVQSFHLIYDLQQPARAIRLHRVWLQRGR